MVVLLWKEGNCGNLPLTDNLPRNRRRHTLQPAIASAARKHQEQNDNARPRPGVESSAHSKSADRLDKGKDIRRSQHIGNDEDQEDDEKNPKNATTGRHVGELVVITSGLDAGERVVVRDVAALSDGLQVGAVQAGKTAGP